MSKAHFRTGLNILLVVFFGPPILQPSPALAEDPRNRFAAAGKERPNLVVMFADDLTFRALGMTGQTEVKTPHLDRLAARGTTFTHAFIQGGTSGAVCV